MPKPNKRKTEQTRNKPSPKLEFAVKWLSEYLGEYSHPARRCIWDARKAGITRNTLQRAKRELSIHTFQRNHKWYWCLI